MWWIILTLLGYFFNSVATVVDKYLLSGRIPSPLLYMWYTGILSAGVVVLIPFGVTFISWPLLGVALLSGVLLLLSLGVLYEAVRRWEISRVAPLVGGFSALCTLVLSWVFFSSRFSMLELAAFLFLLGAGVTLGIDVTHRVTIRWDVVGLSFVSGLLLAGTFVLSGYIFSLTSFVSGFFWMRMGSALLAVLLLVVPVLRERITAVHSYTSGGSLGLVVANKAVAALGFIVLNGAIALGPVALVNAFKASEYIFVFFVATLFSLYVPRIVSERLTPLVLFQKLLGLVLVVVSVYLVSLPIV